MNYEELCKKLTYSLWTLTKANGHYPNSAEIISIEAFRGYDGLEDYVVEIDEVTDPSGWKISLVPPKALERRAKVAELAAVLGDALDNSHWGMDTSSWSNDDRQNLAEALLEMVEAKESKW